MPSVASRAAPTASAFRGLGMPSLRAPQLSRWTPNFDVVDQKGISRDAANVGALSDEQFTASGSVSAEDFGSPLQSIMDLISNDR